MRNYIIMRCFCFSVWQWIQDASGNLYFSMHILPTAIFRGKMLLKKSLDDRDQRSLEHLVKSNREKKSTGYD